MKRIRKIFSWIGTFLCACVLGIALFINFFPTLADTYFPYRIYTILTGSMEPILPVNSLVVVKSLQGTEPISGDIVTFHANRLGEDITLTHFFAKTEEKDGNVYYRTHANGNETYDIYDTTYEDIKGTYVTHIPYIGRYVLFLGSPYGIGMMGICFIVLVLFHYLEEHFDLDEELHVPSMKFKRHKKKDETLHIRNLQIYEEGDYVVTKGEIWNHTSIGVRYLKGKIIFKDKEGNTVITRVFYLIGRQALEKGQCGHWNVRVKTLDHMDEVEIKILHAKKSIKKL